MFSDITAENGVVYSASSFLDTPHAFTTRFGGVSGGVYKSLNLGEHRGDAEDCVRENYSRLYGALSVENAVFTRQVHGNAVHLASSRDAHELFSPVPYEADGLITGEPELALVIFTADCIPVLFFDPVRRAVGAAHAGWRGTVADIAGETVRELARNFGCRPADIRAAIGPGISRCCFETGPEVPEAVKKILGGDAGEYIDEHGNGKFHVDLKGVNRALLIRAGLSPENIDVSRECTGCLQEKYWSHRRTNGVRGSQASVIVLRGA